MKLRGTRTSAVGLFGALVLGGCTPDGSGGPDGGQQGTVVGQSSVELDTRIVVTHVGEAAIGNFLADALKGELEAEGKTVDVAIVNAGSIRGGAVDATTFQFASEEARLGRKYPAGPITDVDVAGWAPFRNDTALLSLNGTQLKSVLERSAAALPPDLKREEGGWFLHASGLTYAIDCAGVRQKLTADKSAVETEGTRVSRIAVGDDVLYDATVDPVVDKLADAQVRVAVNNFIANGLDGHLAFKAGTEGETIPYDDFDFVAQVGEYIEAHSPIAPQVEGRITIQGDCGQPATLP